MKVEEYLGDGVYAAFDGSIISLDLRAQDSTTRIYMEPETINALVRFQARCKDAYAADREARAIDDEYERARDAGTLPERDEHGVRIFTQE